MRMFDVHAEAQLLEYAPFGLDYLRLQLYVILIQNHGLYCSAQKNNTQNRKPTGLACPAKRFLWDVQHAHSIAIKPPLNKVIKH